MKGEDMEIGLRDRKEYGEEYYWLVKGEERREGGRDESGLKEDIGKSMKEL